MKFQKKKREAKREEKIKQSGAVAGVFGPGLPWQQSAGMQINSVQSTRGGMQPFCLRFGGEVLRSAAYGTAKGFFFWEGGGVGGDCASIAHIRIFG